MSLAHREFSWHPITDYHFVSTEESMLITDAA
jgi:hypothetical protein